MHTVDWVIVIGFLLFISAAAIYTNRYMKSVASFLSAERCAGRYLLAIAAGMSAFGAISIIAGYEMCYKAGFVAKWWEMIYVPIALMIVLTGWVTYRFRQTRAMTMAQFFEMRYSRKFRIFAGILAFGSGIINFGIFPSVGARFFMYFCDLPDELKIAGVGFSTFIVLMVFLLAISLAFALLGGQIAVMVTDFLQGSFFNLASIVIIIFLFFFFDWSHISESLLNAPVEESKVNPFNTGGEKDFNVWFFLIHAFYMIYATHGWQGSQGYLSSGKSAHEQKMAGVLGQWRAYVLFLLVVIAPICAYCLMNHPAYSDQAELVNQSLNRISVDPGDAVRRSMVVPVVLKTILPTGLMGIMCAVMLAAFISTHDTYLHSWGVIFIQDVVMPFRKKPLGKKQHIWLLRWSIAGVTLFVFMFSCFFKQVDYILMFFAITGAIFLGGVGSVLIGGLYWKKGSTMAAYFAMITGATIAVGGIVAEKLVENWPINGQVMFFIAMMSSIVVYVVISLCGSTNCNMDKLFHRGKYAIDGVVVVESEEDMVKKGLIKHCWAKLITNEFTRKDKLLYAATLCWGIGWFVIFVVGCIANAIFDLPDQLWMSFWKIWFFALFTTSIVVVGWFIVGGVRNLFEMFAVLESRKADAQDDGWVDNKDDCEVEVCE